MSLKKTLSVFLSVTTMVWLLGPAVAFGAVVAINDGDLIRGPDGITVYIVKPSVHGAFSGYKRHIFNPAVFNMYGHFNWNNIKAVDQVQLDSYQTSDIYRVDGDSKVYGMEEVDMVSGIAHKRWVNMTAEEYIAKGYSWEQIFTINTAEGNYYTTGTDITYSGTPAQTQTGALNVSLAATNPVSRVVAGNTAYNDVLTVNVSAGSQAASVTGLTITKYGLLANTAVNGISVWDASGKRHGNILTSWTSDNKVTIAFEGDPINVAANSSTTVKVSVNLSDAATTGTMYFGVAAATDVASGGSVGGTFPVTGNVMSITDGTTSLAAYTLDDQVVGGVSNVTTTGNIDIGDLAKEIGKFKFTETSSHEDMVLKRLTVYLEGSLIETSDVKNFKLVDQNGVTVATAERAYDRYVTFDLATSYLITKGQTKTFSVKADILDGATRYFLVHVQNDYDMMVMGATTGFYIKPTGFTDAVDNASGRFNIKQGTLTVTKSSDSPSGEIAPGSTGVVLAKFDLKSSGEKMEIRKVDLYIAKAAGALDLSGTVKLQNVGGTETYLSESGSTASLYADSATRYDLSSYLTLESNQTKTIVVVGDVNSTATSGGQYTVEVRNFYAKRFSTNDYADNIPSASSYTPANQLTVSAIALSVNTNSAVASKNVAAGSTGVVIGSYALQASSAEDIRVNTINLAWDDATQTGTPSTDLANLSLWDGSTQLGSTIGTPNDASNAFSMNLLVPKSSTKIIDVKANVQTTAVTDRTVITKLDASAVTGSGVTSGASIPATDAKAGQTMTFKGGILTITKDSSSSGSKILTAGLSGVELSKINFAAANEALVLAKLALSVSGNPQNFGTVYLKDGSSTIGSTSLFGNDAVFTGLSVTVPADGTKILGVYADITNSGVMTPASTVSIGLRGTTATTDFIVHKSSGGDLSSITASTLAASSTYLFHNTVPTIAKHASSPSGTLTPSANQELFRFTVTAQGTRDMRVASVDVKLSQAGMAGLGAVDTFELWDADLSTKLATNDTSVASSSAAYTLAFNSTNDVSSALAALTVSAGASKTFSVRANTAAIRTGLGSSENARLTLSVDGSTGFETGNATAEADWTEGGIYYFYTPVSGTENAASYRASDSYPVSGSTLTY